MKSLFVAINVNDLKMFIPLLHEMPDWDNTLAIRAHAYKLWSNPSKLRDLKDIPNCNIVLIKDHSSLSRMLSEKFDASFMNAGQFYKIINWYSLSKQHIKNMGKKIGISWFLDLFAKSAVGKLELLDHVVVQSKAALSVYKMFPVYKERSKHVEKCLQNIQDKLFWSSPYFDFKHYCRSVDQVRNDWGLSTDDKVALLVHSTMRGNNLVATQKCYIKLSRIWRKLGYKVIVKMKNNTPPVSVKQCDMVIQESSVHDLFSFAEACSISDVMVMMRETMSLFEAGMYNIPILLPKEYTKPNMFKHFWKIIKGYPWSYVESVTPESLVEMQGVDSTSWLNKWVSLDETNAKRLVREIVNV